MAARIEVGWQSEKTLSECMRYMLDNEIATDVCFEVGPPDGETVNIRAHKYMLMSRSPVFEAMFSSGMTESNSGPHVKIRVEDVEASIFKDLLLYIYCEDVSVNVETVSSLMYAANKYLLPKLVKECGKCLSKGLNIDNVIRILEESLLFDDSKLRRKCLQLIAMNATTVLTGTEILSASSQIIETILQMDRIPVKEMTIWQTCLNWAKHQFKIQHSKENPTDSEIREILGDLLYKIRFPSMDQKEFAEISESSNVLTAEEKLSIFYFLTSKKESCQFVFPTEPRLGEEVWIERSVTCVSACWKAAGRTDAINFKTNQDILLTGIGLYVGFNGAWYDADVEILQSTNSLFKKRVSVPPTGGELNQFKVFLNEPISIKAGIVHTVKSLSRGNIGHYGSPCQPVCTKDKITFTFSVHPESNPNTRENCGQIPRLYFCSY